MLRLLDAHPAAFRTVKAVLDRVVHDAEARPAGETVRALAAAFDEAARAAPEASVALYALGSPELLLAATAEIVAALRRWGVLGRDRSMLEIGCGIGRFEEALAAELALAVGIDVAAAMLRAARARCAGLANVSFLQHLRPRSRAFPRSQLRPRLGGRFLPLSLPGRVRARRPARRGGGAGAAARRRPRHPQPVLSRRPRGGPPRPRRARDGRVRSSAATARASSATGMAPPSTSCAGAT